MGKWVLLGVLALAGIGAMMVAGSYNNLNKLDQGVQAQWGQVENVYQRRLDLVDEDERERHRKGGESDEEEDGQGGLAVLPGQPRRHGTRPEALDPPHQRIHPGIVERLVHHLRQFHPQQRT